MDNGRHYSKLLFGALSHGSRAVIPPCTCRDEGARIEAGLFALIYPGLARWVPCHLQTLHESM